MEALATEFIAISECMKKLNHSVSLCRLVKPSLDFLRFDHEAQNASYIQGRFFGYRLNFFSNK
jgi:hypothetical protein